MPLVNYEDEYIEFPDDMPEPEINNAMRSYEARKRIEPTLENMNFLVNRILWTTADRDLAPKDKMDLYKKYIKISVDNFKEFLTMATTRTKKNPKYDPQSDDPNLRAERVPIDNDEELGQLGLDIASSLVNPGGAGVAGIGIGIGRAKAFGKEDDVFRAINMSEKGVAPEKIFNETKMYKGTDQEWRMWVSDQDFKPTQKTLDYFKKDKERLKSSLDNYISNYDKFNFHERRLFAGQNAMSGNRDTWKLFTSLNQALEDIRFYGPLAKTNTGKLGLRYKQIILNSKATLNAVYNQILEHPDIGFPINRDPIQGNIREFFTHPELEKAYPKELDRIMIEMQYDFDKSGSWHKGDGITGDKNMMWYDPAATGRIFAKGRHLSDLHSVIQHELTHFIQDTEGFSTGASPDHIKKYIDSNVNNILNDISDELKIEKDPSKRLLLTLEKEDYLNKYNKVKGLTDYEAYRRAMGEVEARAMERALELQKTLRHESFYPWKFDDGNGQGIMDIDPEKETLIDLRTD